MASSKNGNGLPAAIDIEKALLGAILIEPEVLDMIGGTVTTEDLYSEAHRLTYRHLARLADEHQPVDANILIESLRSEGSLARAGGASYIASLTDGAVDATSEIAARYCRIIKDKSRLRRIILDSDAIRTKALSAAANVSDVLEDCKASYAKIQAEMADTAVSGVPVLVPLGTFMERHSHKHDWMVESIIENGSNGFIVANPKVGKSFVSTDLALSLALGIDWLEFRVFRHYKVALISREDNPNLTKWRIRRLLAGHGKTEGDVGPWLYVNSKDQSPQFRLDVPEQLNEMIAALKIVEPQFVILDVLNILHSAEENDNTAMRKVLDCAERIHREVHCSLCIIHHFTKDKATQDSRLNQRMRGAGAIAGFAEWIIGVEFASRKPNERVRYMDFDMKADAQPDRIYWTIVGEKEDDYSKIVRSAAPAEEKSYGRKHLS